MIVIIITSLHVPGIVVNAILILSLKIVIMTLEGEHYY